MANWTWPYTPNSRFARLVIVGGPFDGIEAGFLPPDLAAPIQIVWSAWFPWGFSALIHEWQRETVIDRGRTDALVFRPLRWLPPAEIPPTVGQEVETLADTAAAIVEAFDIPPEMVWPGG